MRQLRRGEMSLEQVQQWVLTALICAVSSFPIGALIVVTHLNQPRDPSEAVMLCVMTGVIGIIAMSVVLLVHRRSPVSLLLVVGVTPALASAVWTWGF